MDADFTVAIGRISPTIIAVKLVDGGWRGAGELWNEDGYTLSLRPHYADYVMSRYALALSTWTFVVWKNFMNEAWAQKWLDNILPLIYDIGGNTSRMSEEDVEMVRASLK